MPEELLRAQALQATQRLVAACVGRQVSTLSRKDFSSFSENPHSLSIARIHGVAPFLGACEGITSNLAPSIADSLSDALRRTAASNAMLNRELRVALGALADLSNHALVLKGAALSGSLYGELGSRPMSDCDILVAREELDRATSLLRAVGFEPELSSSIGKNVFEFEPELVFKKMAPIEVTLELHWSLLDNPYYQEHLDLDWFVSDPVAFEMGSESANTLRPEANLLYLASHLYLHHGGDRLIWLVDIAKLLQKHGKDFHWPALVRLAREQQLLIPLRAAIEDCGAILDVADAGANSAVSSVEPLRAEVQRYEDSVAIEPIAGKRFVSDIRSIGGLGRKARFTMLNLFPSPAYMRSRYSTSSLLLLPFLYPYRWLIGIGGLFRSTK